METKNLTKIVRRKHRWSTSQIYDLTHMYWDMGFVLGSLACGGMAVGAFWYAKDLWVILALHACIFSMIILFSINIIRLVKHLAEMLCAIYHVVRVNVDEQKDIDFGSSITYYDPVSQVEINEERYDELFHDEQQKYIRKTTVIVPHDLDAIRKGEEE